MYTAEYIYEKHIFSVKTVMVRSASFCYGDFRVPSSRDLDDTSFIHCIKRVSDIIDKSGSKKTADTVQEMLLVLELYRGKSELLCRMISEWICDLCLINGELAYLSGLFCRKLSATYLTADFLVGDFIEAFLQNNKENIRRKLICALPYMCDYAYAASEPKRKNSELYETVVTEAVLAVLDVARNDDEGAFFSHRTAKVVRCAYQGLVCKCENSKILEIEYISYSENSHLRALVTSAVKYADNLVRQGLGIKSKLPCTGLLPEYRRCAVEAVRHAVPELLPVPSKVGRKPKPENEKKRKEREAQISEMYEPISLDIDFAKAKRLEAESWRLAELVGSDYGGAQLEFSAPALEKDMPRESTCDKPAKDMNSVADAYGTGEWAEFLEALTDKEKRVLVCILCGGDVAALSKSLGGMAHGFADSINEKAQDTYGDIIIETDADGVFCVFEDYAAEISEIINSNTEVQ